MYLLGVVTFLALITRSLPQNPNNTNGIGSYPSDRHHITAHQAEIVVTAAVANATAISIPQNVAVVDPSGPLVAFLRMDNAYVGSIDISIKKARTAVIFNGVSSGGLYASSQLGGALYGIEETNGGLVVFGGGFPNYLDGFLIGGIGVSGGTVPQDVEAATAGVLGLNAKTSAS